MIGSSRSTGNIRVGVALIHDIMNFDRFSTVIAPPPACMIPAIHLLYLLFLSLHSFGLMSAKDRHQQAPKSPPNRPPLLLNAEIPESVFCGNGILKSRNENGIFSIWPCWYVWPYPSTSPAYPRTHFCILLLTGVHTVGALSSTTLTDDYHGVSLGAYNFIYLRIDRVLSTFAQILSPVELGGGRQCPSLLWIPLFFTTFLITNFEQTLLSDNSFIFAFS